MTTRILLSLLFSFGVFSVSRVSANEPTWIRKLETAKQSAKSAGKDLFMVFTGHGWCSACELLDREVFQAPDFTDATAKNYVFVEFDFTFGESPDETKRRTEFLKLRSDYLAAVVPTVVLANSDGLPYGFITGYEPGAGPQAYLKQVATARTASQKRDEHFSAAAVSVGEARAKHLHDGLESIAPVLGSINERGDDAILHFYGETIREILELTGNRGEIADKFVSRRKKRDEWRSSEAVFAKLNEFNAERDCDGAINYIGRCLETVTSDSMRWRLELSRQSYLKQSGRYEEALANCRRLLAMNPPEEIYRGSLQLHEVDNLFRLNRIAEAIACFDERLKEAGGDKAKQLRILHWKAQMMLGRVSTEQSIEAWRAFQSATKKGTDEWFIATAILAGELRKAGRPQDSLHLLKEFLRERKTAWHLVDAAESYLALGNREEALKMIAEAESLNETQAKSPRQSDREVSTNVAARIKQLRQHITEDATPDSIRDPKE